MPEPSETVRVVYTVQEYADYMRVSERTIERMIKAGKLPIHRVGRCVRIVLFRPRRPRAH